MTSSWSINVLSHNTVFGNMQRLYYSVGGHFIIVTMNTWHKSLNKKLDKCRLQVLRCHAWGLPRQRVIQTKNVCSGPECMTFMLKCVRDGAKYHSSFNAVGPSDTIKRHIMMTSSNGNIFRVTGHLCGEFTGPRWIPRIKASDAEFWCFPWSASE